jgi:hypothetical protein
MASPAEPTPSLAVLLAALDEVIAILQAHGVDHWVGWLAADRQRLVDGDLDALSHLLQAFGGMGSLNDLVLDPTDRTASSSGIDDRDDNRLDGLRSLIFATALSVQGELGRRADPFHEW